MPNPLYTYKQFYFKQFSLAQVYSLNVKAVLFQAIQFGISTQFSSIWAIDRILSGATAPGQSGPGSNGKELRILQSSSITEALLSLENFYSSAEMKSVYSTAPVNNITEVRMES